MKLKKIFSTILIMTMIITCLPLSQPLKVNAAAKTAVSPDKIGIGLGSNTERPSKVKVTGKPAGASYSFTSSDPSVVMVGTTNGSLIGKAPGTATVTVKQTLKGKVTKIGSCKVNVYQDAKKKVAADDKEKTSFAKGSVLTLSLNTYFKYINTGATYSIKSSDTDIVSITGKPSIKNNFAFTITAKEEGTAAFTLTQTYKGKKKTIGKMNITVLSEAGTAGLLDGPLDKIIEQIYKNVTTPLPRIENIVINGDNSNYYVGLEAADFEEALASESMITAHAYSVCLVRVPKDADVGQVKTKIKENVNPRKWICVGVEPENVLIGNIGNLILLVMTNEEPQQIMDSFYSLDAAAPEVLRSVPDDEGLIRKGDYYAQALEKYDEKSVTRLGDKINDITKKYIKSTSKVYYSVIPDKGYFMKNDSFPQKNYTKMLDTLNKKVTRGTYIPIMDTLKLSDYFKTDHHWKQDKIFDAVNALGDTMGFSVKESSFTENTKTAYKGVYAPLIKGTVPKENLIYLTNTATKKSKVSIYDVKGTSSVYNLDKWDSKVPYDLFLSGPSPLITITNPDAKKTKELLLFGDSFSSSLAPLLLGAYSKITLIDLRFVSTSYLGEVVKFGKQDVLFLYNTAVVNRSYMLK